MAINISIAAGIIGIILIVVVLWDGFETIVLPRRVIRRLRLARLFYRLTWPPWSFLAHAFSSGSRLDTALGFYGPLSLLLLTCVWAAVLIVGFGLLYWALGSSLAAPDQLGGFAADLYMSGTTFFTLGLGDVRPITFGARVITIIEAGMGFGFLALVVAYLPALNQSFSRREASITMLDARAGSPPHRGSHAGEAQPRGRHGGARGNSYPNGSSGRPSCSRAISPTRFSPTIAPSTITNRGWQLLPRCLILRPLCWPVSRVYARDRRN